MTVFESPWGDVAIPDMSVTEYLFSGLGKDMDRVVQIDGPTGREMTAGQLIDGIKSVAGGLTAAGLGAGHTIAIVLPNLPEYTVLFHAVAWAGGTMTTINPTYGAAEMRHQLADARAEAVVTIGMFADTVREAMEGTGCTRIYTLDGADGTLPFSELSGAPIPAQVPVDLAEHVLVLPYSSGTTGLSKGVMLTQRNIVANVAQCAVAARIERGETTVSFLPFFHIFGMVTQMNLFLVMGAALVTMPRFDLEMCLRLLQDHKCRQMYLVPPVALALAKHPLVDRFDLSELEVLLAGAAPMGEELEQALEDRLGCTAIQGYGMTELSPVCHFTDVARPRRGTAGLTVAGTTCRIVDPETGTDLPAGSEGEIWVKGPQVMKGYINNPEATAATITPDGWLKTGDLGLFDEDGYLFIRDRLKELIKHKGFQVAPAELEATLIADPAISDAGVIGIPDPEAGELPVAYVVLAEGAEATEADVKAIIARQLASYKHLHAVRFIDVVPKSPTGKILRRILRDAAAAP